MALLLVYVALALGVSFLCSVMEAVILSVTPSYVAALGREEDSWVGERLQAMKEDIDRPLAAILSLNTIAHTVGAAGAGAQAAVVFGEAYTGVIAAILTLLILVLSEIIPKTLGAVYWRQLAPVVVRVLAPTIIAMKPLVLLSKGITYLLSQDEEQTSFSREEFTAMAEIGEEEGVFEEKESRILRNLFRFNSLRVRDVMTPRTVVFDLPEEKTIGDVVSEHDEFRFSRIPVYNANRDDITGYVLKDEMLLLAAQEEMDVQLRELSREILVVRETLPLPDLLERLLDRLEHIALVVDEYGGMAGIVSMEDVVETLLGMEIVDEADSVEDMQALARQQWFKRAKDLGMVPDEVLDPDKDTEAILRYSITGGQPPPDTSESPSSSEEAS
ncbi:hemolysin [Longibacter salinarum]|uniref:Hemolysin n=1 Tax=Longibacter salinarum TaxID=1850348 RepID=A0A2A8CTI5_9BACT|nr:CNNM domain-containing protein [Longibacter salinarum]PEN10392.1 hemolysin [Longibacter salinarum]